MLFCSVFEVWENRSEGEVHVKPLSSHEGLIEKNLNLVMRHPKISKKMMSETKLFVQSFKHTFFCLENFTFRALPCVRNVFPCSAWWNTLFRISFQGIVYVVAFETHISSHNYCSSHRRFHPKILFTLENTSSYICPDYYLRIRYFMPFMFMKRT